MPADSVPADQLEHTGYAFVKISKALQSKVRAAFTAAQVFFQSDHSSKLRASLPMDLGYREFGAEYSGDSLFRDQHESFSASYRGKGAEARLVSPESIQLYETMIDLIDHLSPYAEQWIVDLAAQFMSPQQAETLGGSVRQWSVAQLNYSQRQRIEAPFINTLHEDGCLITIMSNTGPGLEVRVDGQLQKIRILSDELLVFPGEILWLLSGGKYRPLYHQVRARHETECRMALLFFVDIDPKLCAPWISTAVNHDVNIGARVLRNSARFGLKEWDAD